MKTVVTLHANPYAPIVFDRCYIEVHLDEELIIVVDDDDECVGEYDFDHIVDARFIP